MLHDLGPVSSGASGRIIGGKAVNVSPSPDAQTHPHCRSAPHGRGRHPASGKPTHWKQGRSAKAVADSWFQANDLPPRVRAVLDQSPELKGAELIDAWLERCTDLGDRRGTATQTDLLAVLGVGDELAVMAVEAKVTESFGPLVSEWLGEGGEGKMDRLQRLCDLLGFERGEVGDLRYQLFHRTAAAILEARRYRAAKAVLLVHSFCENATGLSDFTSFFERMGVQGCGKDALGGPAPVGGISLWVGWTSDKCPQEITALSP